MSTSFKSQRMLSLYHIFITISIYSTNMFCSVLWDLCRWVGHDLPLPETWNLTRFVVEWFIPYLAPNVSLKLHYIICNLLKEAKRKKVVPGMKTKNNHIARKKFQSVISTTLSAPEDFRETPWGWENQGGLHRGQESFSEWCCLYKETSFVGSTTFLTPASVCGLHSSAVGWLEHSPGSQVSSHEDSGPSGLCPHVIPMTLVNSLTWSTCALEGGQAEEGVERRVKQIWSIITLICRKTQARRAARPSTFPSILPTPPCHEPSTEATPAHWGYSPHFPLSFCLGAEFLQVRVRFIVFLVNLLLFYQRQLKCHSLYEDSRVMTSQPEDVELHQSFHNTVCPPHLQFLPCSVLVNCLNVLFFPKTWNTWRLESVFSIHLNLPDIYSTSVMW